RAPWPWGPSGGGAWFATGSACGGGAGACGDRKVTGPLPPSGTGWGALGNRVVCTASGGGGSVTVTLGVGSGVGTGPCGERKVTGPLPPSGGGSLFVTGSAEGGAACACGDCKGTGPLPPSGKGWGALGNRLGCTGSGRR